MATKMDITKLAPGETMAQRRHRDRFKLDCHAVCDAVERNPGIPSKRAIADETGLGPARVEQCIDAINANDTPFQRIDYGLATPKGGEYAGRLTRGWFPQRYAVYQHVMGQADTHSALTEHGVRHSRLVRLAYAQGLGTKAAQVVVASILESLDVSIDDLTIEDFETVEDLIVEAAEVEAA